MSIFEALRRPALVHAMVVHFPIVMAVVGVPLAIIAAVFPKRKPLLWTTLFLYAALTLIAWVTAWTGERARDAAPATLAAEVWTHIEAHEEAAEKVWIVSAATALLVLLAFLPHSRTQLVFRGLVVLMALAAALHVSITAHRGAMLVYQHGVGTEVMVPATPGPALDASGVQTPEIGQEGAPLRLSEAVFQERVRPIIEQRCLDCHSGEKPKSGLDLSSLGALLHGGKKGGSAVVVPGDPENSLLVQYLEGTLQPQMPYRDAPLSAEEIGAIREWISGTAGVSP